MKGEDYGGWGGGASCTKVRACAVFATCDYVASSSLRSSLCLTYKPHDPPGPQNQGHQTERVEDPVGSAALAVCYGRCEYEDLVCYEGGGEGV